jgi:hypothetical protein
MHLVDGRGLGMNYSRGGTESHKPKVGVRKRRAGITLIILQHHLRGHGRPWGGDANACIAVTGGRCGAAEQQRDCAETVAKIQVEQCAGTNADSPG